jgi:hypothetical protein
MVEVRKVQNCLCQEAVNFKEGGVNEIKAATAFKLAFSLKKILEWWLTTCPIPGCKGCSVKTTADQSNLRILQ